MGWCCSAGGLDEKRSTTCLDNCCIFCLFSGFSDVPVTEHILSQSVSRPAKWSELLLCTRYLEGNRCLGVLTFLKHILHTSWTVLFERDDEAPQKCAHFNEKIILHSFKSVLSVCWRAWMRHNFEKKLSVKNSDKKEVTDKNKHHCLIFNSAERTILCLFIYFFTELLKHTK